MTNKKNIRKVHVSLGSLALSDLTHKITDTPVQPQPDDPFIRLFPTLNPVFSLKPTAIAGFGSPLPRSEVEFSFPPEDRKRVEAWFSGDFSHVTAPESATLKKNMSAAVISTLKKYATSAKAQNLFISPFCIGWRYRLFDGSAAAPEATELLTPLETPVNLIITSHNIYEKSLHTDVMFSNSPSTILFSIPSPVGAEGCVDLITSVEIFITSPRDIFSQDANVIGIRSVNIGGVRQSVWAYESYEIGNLVSAARADKDFRVIASIPFREIADGKYDTAVPLPIEAGSLERFSTLPKATSEQGDTSSGGTGGVTGVDGWKPYIHAETPPLDLFQTETDKFIRSVYITGIFERSKMKITFYVSNDREKWQRVARASGAVINGLCRIPARWVKIEFELPMRKGDFLDLLVFSLS